MVGPRQDWLAAAPDTGALVADLYAYEAVAAARGYRQVSGIDEAGRGPLAGPVVVAAVHLPPGKRVPGMAAATWRMPTQGAW